MDKPIVIRELLRGIGDDIETSPTDVVHCYGLLWLVPLHCWRPTRQMATVHECKTNADIEERISIVNPFCCHCTKGKSADLSPGNGLVLNCRQ
jgi:hypothetical protein